MDFSFPAYADEYLESLKEAGRSRSTLVRYRSDLKKFFSWLHDSKRTDDLQLLSLQDYEQYIKFLEDSNLSDASIKRLTTVLNGLLNHLDIEPVYLLKESSKSRPLRQLTDRDFITEAEFIRIIKSIKTSSNDSGQKSAREFLIERNLGIIHLIRYYGLTPAEISAIEMKDINLAQGTLLVQGSTGEQKISIAKKHLKYLTDYLNKIDKLKRPRIRTPDALFVAFNNTSSSFQFDYLISRPKRLSVRSIQEMIKDEVLRAGLRKISATNLRNSYILDLLLKEIPDDKVMSASRLTDSFSLRRYKIYRNAMETK